MTQRRAVGAALVLITVTVAVMSAHFGVMRVAGQASILPRLGAPGPGDCVAAVAGPVSTGLPNGSVALDTVGAMGVRFADCSEEHVGEIVGLRWITPEQNQPMGNDRWCAAVAAQVGARPEWQVPVASGEAWMPAPEQRFLLILSGFAGDHAVNWAACTVASPGFERYRGSFVQSINHGSAPAPFGLCRRTEDSGAWASCSAPHQVQEFGTTPGQADPTDTPSCALLVSRITGMPDVTAGGRLRVDVSVPDDRATMVRVGPTVAICRLVTVGGLTLDGSLVGVRGRPLPWT